jgi:hypothetical protein
MNSGGNHKKWPGAATVAACLGLALTLVALPSLPQEASGAAALPVVTFTFDFPGSEPEHYVLQAAADGHATYDSNGKLSPQSDGSEQFHLDFILSDANRSRIFELARRANYFERDLDSHKKGLASTGAKTLAYRDSRARFQSTYNYSALPAVQDLTQLFQNLSATLEFGHRLDYYHHYQKLALDDELKRMEQMAKNHDLAELQAVAAILQRIASDTTVINGVRARALRLLELAAASGE